MKLHLTILSCFFCAAIFSVHGQGSIVPNGVVTNLFPGEIDVWNSGTQTTGFSFTSSNSTTFFFGEPATIGVRVFSVSPNDPVSLQPILAQSYTELNIGNSYVYNLGTPFYVGLYTGASIAPPYPPYPPYIYTDPVFGWAELENINGTIELLNSALEYQGGGIYAGTETIIPVPEPGTWTLLFFAAGMIGVARYGSSKLKS